MKKLIGKNSELKVKHVIIITLLTAFILTLITGCAGTREGCWKGWEPKHRTNKMKV